MARDWLKTINAGVPGIGKGNSQVYTLVLRYPYLNVYVIYENCQRLSKFSQNDEILSNLITLAFSKTERFGPFFSKKKYKKKLFKNKEEIGLFFQNWAFSKQKEEIGPFTKKEQEVGPFP